MLDLGGSKYIYLLFVPETNFFLFGVGHGVHEVVFQSRQGPFIVEIFGS